MALGLATIPELEFLDLSGTMLAGDLSTSCGLASTDRLRQLNLAQVSHLFLGLYKHQFSNASGLNGFWPSGGEKVAKLPRCAYP